MERLKKIVKSYLLDWPPLGWSTLVYWLAALLAKGTILGSFVGIVMFLVPGIPILGLGVLLALLLCLVTVLFMVLLVGWSPERKGVFRPREMPDSSRQEVDMVRLLGPFNARPSLRFYDAVFEGGGVKAIGQIGALKCFEEEGLRPRSIAGTSGGAIVGALLAAGAESRDLWEILGQLDLTELLDPRLVPNRRWLRRALYGVMPLVPSLVLRKALVRGERFRELMSEHLQRVSGLDHDPTFRDLRELTGRELSILATDVTRRKAIILPKDIVAYQNWGGPDPDDLPVSFAVRMSMAIPFVFEPVRLKLQDGPATADIIDGGVSSNFPIWLFDSHARSGPRHPTFGFLLDETVGKPIAAYRNIRWLLPYAFNVIQAGIGAVDRILDEHNSERTIRIPTYQVATTDFDLTEQQQRQLFEGGYNAAREKLETFDWNAYILRYRGGRARVPEEARQFVTARELEPEAAPAAPPAAIAPGVEPFAAVQEVEYSL